MIDIRSGLTKFQLIMNLKSILYLTDKNYSLLSVFKTSQKPMTKTVNKIDYSSDYFFFIDPCLFNLMTMGNFNLIGNACRSLQVQ